MCTIKSPTFNVQFTFEKCIHLSGEAHSETTHPGQATLVITCVSYFTTGGPRKEQGTNKSPPTGRAQERSKGDTTCLTTSQNPSLWQPSCLSNLCATRRVWLAKDTPETNPIKPKTASHQAEQSSWVPLLYFSPPRHPFPITSLALCPLMCLLGQFISEC